MSDFIAYKASAGSGKTYTLAVEYIKQLLLADDLYPHRHILAVTFTKEATGEMKDRIIAELYGLAAGLSESQDFRRSVQEKLSEAFKPLSDNEIQQKSRQILSEILHDYSRFFVGTIDSFFQRVLRNLARELGKGSKFNIELNTVRVVDEAVRAMIEKSNENPALLNWISRYVEEKIAQGQSWKVDKELKQFGQNIFNEYFQEHEAALRRQLEENPNLVDEMIREHKKIRDTFELKMEAFANRFFNNNPSEEDFYYKKNGIPGYFKKLKNGDYSEPNSYVKKVLDGEAGKTDDLKYLALLQETEQAREDGIESFNSSVILLKNIHQLALLWDIALEMEEQNREQNRFMLSQTALFLSQMIADSDASFVYEKIGSEVKTVMIDEFQDTSRLQWRNFKSLLSEILANRNFSLLVGDVKQSIYRWRNGDWSIFNQLEHELPVNIKNLDTNYRSTQRVVEFNNTFFVQAARKLSNKLVAEFSDTVENPFPTAYRAENVIQKCNKPDKHGFVSLQFLGKDENFDYETQVYAALLEHLKNLRSAGVSAQDICILTRTNAQIKSIAAQLSAQKDALPELYAEGFLNIISNDAFQLDASPALKIIIEALRLLTDWENKVYRAELLMLWKEFEANNARSNTNMYELLASRDLDSLLPEGFRRNDYGALELMPLYDLVLYIYELFIMPITDNKNTTGTYLLLDQSAYMYAFLDNLNDYLQQNPSDIKAFLAFWDEELYRRPVPKKSEFAGVHAMTIHKSKGLQFHTVVLPFADWDMARPSNPYQKNLVWCSRKNPPYDLEILPVEYTRMMKQSVFAREFAHETMQLWLDNLNVLYVAFTRAESNLIVLGKQPPKQGKTLTISSLMYEMFDDFSIGEKTENSFIFGEIVPSETKTESGSENVMKKKTNSDNVMIKFEVQAAAVEFRQSNKSVEFVQNGELPEEKSYIKQGNVMHALFAKIRTTSDIEFAVDELIFDGLIRSTEKQQYIERIQAAISESGVQDWFSDNYKLFNECEILLKDECGHSISRRPDRVMIGNSEVLVVDYKFGEANTRYQKQVQNYAALLRQMGYSNVSGYLWFVNENRIEKIPS
ncbi:MAG: UvrD-helicase domain-containing protein [Prevotellaceae bacterium]|nr:UvrD-helicase domain-containing protein [Prevotellaceae bacterium]